MRGCTPPVIIAYRSQMSTRESNPHRRVIIDFEPGSQPINGVVRGRGLAPRPFTGWLALMASLEAVSTIKAARARHIGGDRDRGPSNEARSQAKDQTKGGGSWSD
jgi:hypothetical protein